ncbi:MAG: chromosome partition protein MukB, partial [Polyangiaceae bacterium]
MSRARASGLALVNWKGVFFERYKLDRHVTALEGANGAGKTTVMIAAYVVLLPDMTRLRFTNLGESAASAGDRGIWGRLGEPGRPSYSVIDFEHGDGQRVLAGVQLSRKAEPSVELAPFLIHGADASLRMSDLLLVSRDGHDEVPSLEEFAEHVRARGARLEVFQSAKEYFSALFERGIAPLRLNSDEERNKLNEMLRTSMTGGISRALTSELRSFLLREESGLSDTLRRMRENLDACRRTRGEVAESRALEHEISSIYDAGQAMFAAAFGSARKRAEELSERTHAAGLEVERAQAALERLSLSLREVDAREAALNERRQQAQLEHARSRERAERTERARALSHKLKALRGERDHTEAEAAEARAKRERSNAQRKERKQQRDQLRESYERAARGLSDSERGLDELHRAAADQRRARRLLEEARSLLEGAGLDPNAPQHAATQVQLELRELDLERARRDRKRELAELRRRDRERALSALRLLSPSASESDAHGEARRALAEFSELERLAAQRKVLSVAREEAWALAARQRALRARASELGLPEAARTTLLAEHLAATEARLRDAEQQAAAHAADGEAVRHAIEQAQQRRRTLEDQTLLFDDLNVRRRRLHSLCGAEPSTREELTALHRELFAQRELLHRSARELGHEREQARSAQSSLDSGGGHLDPELLALCEELDGELLASRFEEVDSAEAALVEAELGPLTRAIIVDDAARAAEEVLRSKHALESLCLVQEGADPRNRSAPPRVEGQSVVFRESYGVRLARLPERPTLGFRARKRRGEELEKRTREIDGEIEGLDERLRKCEGALRECEELAARAGELELGDPRGDLQAVQQRERELTGEAARHDEAGRAELDRAAAARTERDALLGLLAEGFLLDPPDHGARATELDVELQRASSAREELDRLGSARDELALLLDALLEPAAAAAPSDDDEAALEQRRDRLFRARDTLGEFERVRHTLSFDDAEAALQAQRALLPSLEAQHQGARQALERAEAELAELEQEWENGALSVAETEARRAAVEAHEQRLRGELAELEVDAEADDATARAHSAVVHWAGELAAIERDERTFAAERAVRNERQQQAKERLNGCQAALDEARIEAEPAAQSYQALCAAAEKAQLSLASAPTEAALSNRASAALAADAASKLELLWGRLSTARGGAELSTQLQA